MAFEDDRGLVHGVLIGKVPILEVWAIIQANSFFVWTFGWRQIEGAAWAEGVFGEQLVVQVDICTMSVNNKNIG